MINRFGTTSDMVIQQVEEAGVRYALAIDGKGLYLTLPDRLDSMLADTYRYDARRAGMEARLTALGLDPAALFKENRHRIKAAAGEPAKKVNPLKASKRAMKK